MPDNTTFVVNDRRKFTADGELRHDLPAAEPSTRPDADESAKGPQLVSSSSGATNEATTAELSDLPESEAIGQLEPQQGFSQELGDVEGDGGTFAESFPEDEALPPGPTAEQSAEATRAYDATVDRLDTALRAANPGGERMPEMSFERLVQSLYTQALMLLGGGAEPGETPRVDILGARQTIDMLAVIADKSKGNLSASEDKLLESALFDLHMGFLEITQALARQAAQRQGAGGPGAAGGFGGPMAGGPRIVR